MKRIDKRAAGALVLVLVASVVLAACGSSGGSSTGGSTGGGGSTAESGETYKVGMIVPAPTVKFYEQVAEGAEAASKTHSNIEFTMNVLAEGLSQNATEQSNQDIDGLITKGMNAIIIVPALQQNAPYLEKAINDGIKVVASDLNQSGIKSGPEGKIGFVGTNNVAAGRAGGEYIAEHLEKGGTVGLLGAVEEILPSWQRTNEAIPAIEAAGINVAAQTETGCEPEPTVKVLQNMLTANPEINYLFAGCGGAAQAAARYLEQKGELGKIEVMGHDGAPEEIELVEEGKIVATVAERPYAEGFIAVNETVKYLESGEIFANVNIPFALVDKSNVKSFDAEAIPKGSETEGPDEVELEEEKE